MYVQACTYRRTGYDELAKEFGRLSCVCTIVAMALSLILVLLAACVLLVLYMVNDGSL